MKRLALLCAMALSSQLLTIAKEKVPLTEAQQNLAHIRQILSSGRPEEGEKLLTEFLRSNSTNLVARQLHAEVLYQLHRYHYAADEIREVLKDHPEDADALLLMGKIYQSIHKPAKAVEMYNSYLAQAKPSDTTAQYKTLVQLLAEQTKNEEEKQTQNRAKVGNYLSAVGGSGFARWKNANSIRVYVKDGSQVNGYRPEFEEALRQAFDDWTESTKGVIGFVFVPAPGDAQMSVTWTSDLKAPALKAEAGLAKTQSGAEGLASAEILLLTLDPFKEGPIGTNYLFNVCLHEIGHALGLQGHSPYAEDIMSPQLYVQQGLSDRDINTVLALYSQTDPAESLPDKDEYGRPLSKEARSNRLVQQGTAATMAGQYEKAIEKLQAALTLNPANELARKNIAASANNLAISQGMTAEKEMSLLHLALYWQPQNKAARDNLSSLLQMQGRDPRSFSARTQLAEQCLKQHDSIGAVAEYREALTIKDDPSVKQKLNALLATGPSAPTAARH